jgi:hypothetical protein
MIDRDNAVYKVPKMRFPRRKELAANIKETLLDGVSSTFSKVCNCMKVSKNSSE